MFFLFCFFTLTRSNIFLLQQAHGMLGNGILNLDRQTPYPVSYLLDLNIKVKHISAGAQFNLVLSEDGMIYSWGKNDSGQLGLGGGFNLDVESVPRPVEFLKDEKVTYVSAGTNHSACVTEKGEVYMWGHSTWVNPTRMLALAHKRIVKVACGYHFTAALSDAGEVFTWAKGYFAQRNGVLGRGNVSILQNSFIKQPGLVKGIPPVSEISCGDSHVLMLSGLPS